MRLTMAVCLLVLLSCVANAATRNCTTQERADANAQLEVFESDDEHEDAGAE